MYEQRRLATQEAQRQAVQKPVLFQKTGLLPGPPGGIESTKKRGQVGDNTGQPQINGHLREKVVGMMRLPEVRKKG